MSPDDERRRAKRKAFGENLRAVRERSGMGQRELAARMTEEGFQWHQNTVTRVEAGMRRADFDEAESLAWILGVTTDRFTWAGPEATAVTLMNGANGRLRGAWRDVADAAARLRAARSAAEKAVGDYQDSEYERVRNAARGLRGELESATLESALNEAEELRHRTERGEI